MSLTVKRENDLDKMLGDFITLPLDEKDDSSKDKALGRENSKNTNKQN